MKNIIKKTAITMVAAVMVLGTSTIVMANEVPARFTAACIGRGLGWESRGMMRDDNGNFLTREAFEQRIDGLIAEGRLNSGERASMLDIFDWCVSNDGVAAGMRGGCGRVRGQGQGFNRF